MGQDCLDRRTLSALAAGRCPRNELRAVQRHLPTCARCRAAVVASAAGVRGPGDTVLLTRPGQRREGPARTAFKVASVAASVLVVGAAWFYGSALSEAPPPSVTGFTPSPVAPAPTPRAEPPTPASSDTPTSDTRAAAAALHPEQPVSQVQARLLIEPSASADAPSMNAPATATTPEPAAAVDPAAASSLPGVAPPAGAAHASTRPKRPPAKKATRPTYRSRSADLPSTAEAEGTDRFGLEW